MELPGKRIRESVEDWNDPGPHNIKRKYTPKQWNGINRIAAFTGYIPLWLEDIIVHQGYKKQPVRLEKDNQSSIALLNKGRSTAETTRFIEVRMFWISD
jgi:hypothetical protein